MVDQLAHDSHQWSLSWCMMPLSRNRGVSVCPEGVSAKRNGLGIDSHSPFSVLSLEFVRNEEQIPCSYWSCVYSLLACYLTRGDLYCSHRTALMACWGNLVGEGDVCIVLLGMQYMFQLALLRPHISGYGAATVWSVSTTMPFRVLSDHQCNSLASVSPWNGVFTVSKYFCRNFEAEGTVKGKLTMIQTFSSGCCSGWNFAGWKTKRERRFLGMNCERLSHWAWSSHSIMKERKLSQLHGSTWDTLRSGVKHD